MPRLVDGRAKLPSSELVSEFMGAAVQAGDAFLHSLMNFEPRPHLDSGGSEGI